MKSRKEKKCRFVSFDCMINQPQILLPKQPKVSLSFFFHSQETEKEK
jgi:hypothetical protein